MKFRTKLKNYPKFLHRNALTLKLCLIFFIILILIEFLFFYPLYLNISNFTLIDSKETSLFVVHILKNLIFIAFGIAFLFCVFAFLFIKRKLIKPIQTLYAHLGMILEQKIIEDKHFLAKVPMGALKDVLVKYNQLLKKIQYSNKVIQSYEAIFHIGVDERKQFLVQIANFDSLTGLPNRNFIKEHIEKMIAEAKMTHQPIAIIMLEICDFHEITHVFGQNTGHLFLKEVSKLLLENLPAQTLAAHISTTRFALVKNVITSTSQAVNIAQWILELFSKPFTIDKQNLSTTVNVGIAMYPNDGDDAEMLLVNANLALTRAKKDRPNSFQFYEAHMNQSVSTKRNRLVEMHYALEQEQFCLYYQPQISLKNNTIIGVEALLRWNHPEKGFMPPSEFIPLAEESGLIITLSEWVLKRACQEMKAFHDQGFKGLCVAVNLSTQQFRQKNLVELVNRTLIETELPPECLELEVTESGIMTNPTEAIITMKALHALGAMISIDDFGTSYSSLNYLKSFPVQKLKIDQSFVKDLGTGKDSKPLADIIILLGHTLHLKVIAEGVETQIQADYLREKGCDEAQGYYFGKPTATKDCPELFKNFLKTSHS